MIKDKKDSFRPLTEEQKRNLSHLVTRFFEKGERPVYIKELVRAHGGTSTGWGVTLSHLSRLTPKLVDVKRKAQIRSYTPTEDGKAVFAMEGGRCDNILKEELHSNDGADGPDEA